MRRISVLVTMFLASLGIGFFARSARTATLQQSDARAADLAAIEKLHRADIEATLTQDPSSLTNLWSDDGVNLGFPGPPVVRTKAMREAYEKFRADHPDFQVLKYAPTSKMSKSRMAGRLRLAILQARTRCLQRTIRSVQKAEACVC